MTHKVEYAEQDRSRFLHSQYSVKGPFSVELDDPAWVVCRKLSEACVGDQVLAGIVAFGGAGPKEEAVVKGCGLLVRGCGMDG